MKRREFFKTMTVAAGASAMAGSLVTPLDAVAGPAQAGGSRAPWDLPRPAETVRNGMRYRQLGKTGEQVSLIGLGGHHIGRQKDESESIRIIRSAIDQGMTFMDNSWDYHDGGSERRMGKALRDGYRQRVFLMTKIDGRTREAAARQIEESLGRLQTDHIDLIQHHEILRMEDPDRIFAQGGAMEAVLAAKQAGKVRFIGFTGHKDPLVHLRMLEVAGDHGFHFDTVQMPLDVMDAHFRSFAHKVLPVLVKDGIAVLGMKSMGDGNILKSKTVTPVECLHYAMTLPTSVVITGIDSMDVLKQDLQAVRDFKPLSDAQIAALLEKTAKVAREGRFEPFKTTAQFDSTARRPDWLG